MRNKYLIPLLTSSILAFSASIVWGQENAAPEITFACEDNNTNIPITVARNKEGKTETIFHWKKEVLTYLKGKILTTATPKELCQDVSEKLNGMAKEGYELSSIVFFGQQLDGLNVFCLGFNSGECKKVLFAVKPKQPRIDPANILETIINPKIINDKRILREREHLYMGLYYVDLFE